MLSLWVRATDLEVLPGFEEPLRWWVWCLIRVWVWVWSKGFRGDGSGISGLESDPPPPPCPYPAVSKPHPCCWPYCNAPRCRFTAS